MDHAMSLNLVKVKFSTILYSMKQYFGHNWKDYVNMSKFRNEDKLHVAEKFKCYKCYLAYQKSIKLREYFNFEFFSSKSKGQVNYRSHWTTLTK